MLGQRRQGVASATLNADGKPDVGTNTTCKCRFTDWDGTGPIGSSGAGITQCSDQGGNSHNRIETTVKVVENASGSFKQWYTDSTFSDKVQGVLELQPVAGGSYQFSSSNGRTVNDDPDDGRERQCRARARRQRQRPDARRPRER